MFSGGHLCFLSSSCSRLHRMHCNLVESALWCVNGVTDRSGAPTCGAAVAWKPVARGVKIHLRPNPGAGRGTQELEGRSAGGAAGRQWAGLREDAEVWPPMGFSLFGTCAGCK